jgi:hypothetical protein
MCCVEYPTAHQNGNNMKKIVLAASMTAAVGWAYAQAYVGGAYGQTHVDGDCSGFVSCAQTDNGYKGYVGFVVNQ